MRLNVTKAIARIMQDMETVSITDSSQHTVNMSCEQLDALHDNWQAMESGLIDSARANAALYDKAMIPELLGIPVIEE